MDGKSFIHLTQKRIMKFNGGVYEWLNVKTVEPKLQALEKPGRWLVAQIRQERGQS
jgi:hypothetical protein